MTFLSDKFWTHWIRTYNNKTIQSKECQQKYKRGKIKKYPSKYIFFDTDPQITYSTSHWGKNDGKVFCQSARVKEINIEDDNKEI